MLNSETLAIVQSQRYKHVKTMFYNNDLMKGIFFFKDVLTSHVLVLSSTDVL